MAIADLAASEPPRVKKGPSCSVCRALKELPPADAAGLRAMLGDMAWSFEAIALKIAEDEDTPAWIRAIRKQTYARHAKGDCDACTTLRPGLR